MLYSDRCEKKNIAVFVSGFGSNLNVFLKNKKRFKTLLVVSSNPKAYALERAREHQVESWVLDKPVSWDQFQKRLIKRNVDLIFLAGFMKILPPRFVELWENRLFNLHPSLLPKYKGLESIKRAYEAGDDIGVSIHHVTAQVDEGKIVDQQVAVTKKEGLRLSLEQVTEKVHQKEHQMVQDWIDRYV